MKSSIKTMVNDRLDKIEFNFISANKICRSNDIEINDIKFELKSTASNDVMKLVEKILDLQINKEMVIREEIYKKAFKDGLTFREYL